MYAMVPSISGSEGFIRVIFIGLFALTVPHLTLDTCIDALRYAGVRKCSDDTAAPISV